MDESGQRIPPPPELIKAWQCARWHTLPREGGLDNQFVKVMIRMDAALAVYNAVRSYNEADRAGRVNENWMEHHPHDMTIWTQVQLMRAKQNV